MLTFRTDYRLIFGEEVKADKAIQDIISAVSPPISARELLIRVKHSSVKVLIYGQLQGEPAVVSEKRPKKRIQDLRNFKRSENLMLEALQKPSEADMGLNNFLNVEGSISEARLMALKWIGQKRANLKGTPPKNGKIETEDVRKEKKLGRNEPCWCGSGKKFKQCHGKL